MSAQKLGEVLRAAAKCSPDPDWSAGIFTEGTEGYLAVFEKLHMSQSPMGGFQKLVSILQHLQSPSFLNFKPIQFVLQALPPRFFLNPLVDS